MEHQGDQTVAQIQDGDGSKEEIPEPEDQVNLLIDDVLRQDTHPVVNLQHHFKCQVSYWCCQCTWATPEAPTFGISQLVIVGNTSHIGLLQITSITFIITHIILMIHTGVQGPDHSSAGQ